LIAIRAPRLGGAKLVRLLQAFGGIEGVFSATNGALQSAGLDSETIDYLRSPDADLLRIDEEWLAHPAHHLVTWGSEDYL
jgi:predicted Rossmann fold nucleotide-binding protein DprA/Smf involved in DNA uptake